MNKTLPFKELIRLGLITSPLFGIIRVFPILMVEQINSARNLMSFAFVTCNTIIFWVLNISLLYLFSLLRKEAPVWLRYLCSTVICAIASVLLFRLYLLIGPAMAIPPPRPGVPRPGGGFFLMPVMQSISINIFILTLIDLVIMRTKKDSIENENNKLKIVNLEARHNQLQQQLQPHFLFNSLNLLRALITKQPQQAEEYVIRLSELLRHSMHYSAQSMVPLGEEIALCRNYLEMQQLRFGKALDYSVDIPEDMVQNCKVPSYSLQLLVENAIKHNRLTIDEPLDIRIEATDSLTLSVSNNLQTKEVTSNSGRTGLSNLRERYRILCDANIIVKVVESRFQVQIKVL